jgi:predicted dehydrogenase
MPVRRITRRGFLYSSAAFGAAAIALPALLKIKSPGEKLNVAIIGVAGRGTAQLDAVVANENVAALCDIDEKNLDKAGARIPQAKRFYDFREMLEKMGEKIDAVMVSTPDHTHAPASAMAMRMGKHCYCEKPLTHTVYEARTLAKIAKDKNLVTQMGTQIHATDNYRRVVEMVQAGAIGPVSEVSVWCDKSWGGGRRPKEISPIPSNIHWDEWIGPASFRPYNACYLPANWRRWWDFGNGTLGDMACHLIDLAFWALQLRHPISMEAEGPPIDEEGCPEKVIVRWDFPERGNMPPVKLTWCDGGNKPHLPAGCNIPVKKMGVLFIGKDGVLLADYDSWKLYPEEKFKDFKIPRQSIPNSIGHHQEFFQACKTGKPTTCNFDYAGALTEAVLLGGVSYRVGKKIEWDGPNMKAIDCPEADRYLRCDYRQGWEL